MVAQIYTQKYPDEVGGLVLDSTGGMDAATLKILKKIFLCANCAVVPGALQLRKDEAASDQTGHEPHPQRKPRADCLRLRRPPGYCAERGGVGEEDWGVFGWAGVTCLKAPPVGQPIDAKHPPSHPSVTCGDSFPQGKPFMRCVGANSVRPWSFMLRADSTGSRLITGA